MLEALKTLEKKLRGFYFTEIYGGEGRNAAEQISSAIDKLSGHIYPYSLDDIINARLFFADIARDFGDVNDAYKKKFRFYPTRVAYQPVQMPIVNALVAFCGFVYLGDESYRQITGEGKPVGPYMSAIELDKCCFVSGQIGDVDPNTKRVKGNSLEQLGSAKTKSNNLLKAAGFTSDNVILVELYHTEREIPILVEGIKFIQNYPNAELIAEKVAKLPVDANVELVVTAKKK
jgi:enamine deaminase RidA (YjgF/YER057c/UK114 family)